MRKWDELHTAYQVARLGTVSGAAEALGVHHATVIRHIDALEERLGARLFQRHARGYTPTEAGRDLMQVIESTEDQVKQLVGRIQGKGETVSGDLVVTSLEDFSPRLAPVLAGFRDQHPEVNVRYVTGERLFRLEYGEAHVALRAGSAPDQPDNVVQKLRDESMHLVASPLYLERYGTPKDEGDLINHYFVGPNAEESRAPYNQWLAGAIPADRIVFRADRQRIVMDAVLAGAGIGFVPSWALKDFSALTEVVPPRDDWASSVWIVTHVDLHRTLKVQSFLKYLKEHASSW